MVDVNAVSYLKFQLELKYENNKNYSPIILNSIKVHARKSIYLRLKCRNNKVLTSGQLACILSLVRSLNHLSSGPLTSIRSGFWNRFIFDPFCSNAPIIFVLIFPNRLDRKIYDTKFPTHVSFFYFFFCLFLSFVLLPLFFRRSKTSFCLCL